MALLDYKIVRFSHDKRHVNATVRVYRGAVTTEDEPDNDGNLVPVTRYRRIALVGEKTLSYDVPRDMTKAEFLQKARAYLNDKLLTYATAHSHTVITEQQDIADLEPMINDTGTLEEQAPPEVVLDVNPDPAPDVVPDPDTGTATTT